MLPSFFRFSTAALPERERLAMFREAFGRNLSNMDIMPLDENCWAEIELRALHRPASCGEPTRRIVSRCCTTGLAVRTN